MRTATLQIQQSKLFDKYNKDVPHIMKYMGSKRSILDFVISGIDEVYSGGIICDLFAGSSVLSGSLGSIAQIHSNDIQEYSGHIAKTYLSNYDWEAFPDLDNIISQARRYFNKVKKKYPELIYKYSEELTLIQFNKLEKKQQRLRSKDFDDIDYYLFIKYYSGTYWSFEQCIWIDAIKKVADKYKTSPLYYPIISSLMFAMSYCSQSTGHVAQYRDANDEESMMDILIYRQKEILPYFKRKFLELKKVLKKNTLKHTSTSLSYEKCLDALPENIVIYADPPYCFVHYSRFYHAFETLIKYDYPEIKFKGRYRTDRHQSPFCQRLEVRKAFETMFQKINLKKSQLVLSYSNTGMIRLDELVELANSNFSNNYKIEVKSMPYKHSTMGRTGEKTKDVEEYLIIAKIIV
ncbi:MAG TPA: DNA adenine methylase [Bacteroidia bacterium]|jgi:adenine-specific DNA-methyltransferase|nr:DNA adenine methylase [Bacteroidia bacterium]